MSATRTPLAPAELGRFMQEVPVFSRLTPDQLEALSGRMRRRVFGRGVVIFHQGMPGHALYIIESGSVRIFVLSEAGQEISVNIYGSGEIFGELSLLDGLPHSASAAAMEPMAVWMLFRDDFRRVVQEIPGMAIGIIECLSARLRQTTQYAEQMVFLDVPGRVARELLQLAGRYGTRGDDGSILIDLPLTQGELATMVGATRESVNKVLAHFRTMGYLATEGRRLRILASDELSWLLTSQGWDVVPRSEPASRP